jgi:YD repeat-containing protein
MSTYTFTPLIGVSAVCSPNNLITYYEYDGFGRLQRVRDVDGNIIKQYDYQYQVQTASQGL